LENSIIITKRVTKTAPILRGTENSMESAMAPPGISLREVDMDALKIRSNDISKKCIFSDFNGTLKINSTIFKK